MKRRPGCGLCGTPALRCRLWPSDTWGRRFGEQEGGFREYRWLVLHSPPLGGDPKGLKYSRRSQ